MIRESEQYALLSVVTHAVAVVLLTWLGSFESLALLSGGAICIVYFGTCASAWALQRRNIRQSGTPFMLPGGPLIPAISCVALASILTTLKQAEWQAMGYALSVVLGLYGITRWRPKIKITTH